MFWYSTRKHATQKFDARLMTTSCCQRQRYLYQHSAKFRTFRLVHFHLSLSLRPSFQFSEGLVLRLPFRSADHFQYRHAEEGSGDLTWTAGMQLLDKSRVKHAIYCINHTHPTTTCWLHAVRATVHCLSECCATDSWMKKAMWATKMAQTKAW